MKTAYGRDLPYTVGYPQFPPSALARAQLRNAPRAGNGDFWLTKIAQSDGCEAALQTERQVLQLHITSRVVDVPASHVQRQRDMVPKHVCEGNIVARDSVFQFAVWIAACLAHMFALARIEVVRIGRALGNQPTDLIVD